MVLKRYLINFSYIGTLFRGIQRQTPRGPGAVPDPSTVQGLLEIAIERMNPKNPVLTRCASRTDQGVHALKTSATVDLDFSYEPSPNIIHNTLNTFFDDTGLAIRVQEVRQVPETFSARHHPLWRKYIYRFATAKPNSLNENQYSKKLLPIPITEFDRCYFVRESEFDLEAVNEACKLFIGTHDFITFMGKPKTQPEDVTTIRCMHQLYVEPSHPHIPSSFDDCFNYWQLTCTGKSFLYNQVRRTVSVLLSVGQGKLTIEDVRQMFLEPSPASYPKKLELAPACGLYLADIFYDPADMALPESEQTTEVEEMPEKTQKELIKERLELLRIRKEKELSTS